MKSSNHTNVQTIQVNNHETVVTPQQVTETIETGHKRFSVADLWHIQRNYRTSQVRRCH
ncbi:MAG: hypothetical protein RLY16_2872 [Bacteroidota bacterium]|jgi:hypothetical protein